MGQAHTFNPRTQGAEEGKRLNLRPQNKFQDNQGYPEKSCLEKQIKGLYCTELDQDGPELELFLRLPNTGVTVFIITPGYTFKTVK